MKELNYMTASQSLVSGKVESGKVESYILPSPDQALFLVWLLFCPRPGFLSCFKLKVKKIPESGQPGSFIMGWQGSLWVGSRMRLH